MKNYQKNSRNPSVPFSCMLEQLIGAVQHKSIKWHLNNHIWSLNLNFIFKPTSFNLLLVALAQNTFILPCHDHASYCRIALIVFFLCCRCLFPLSTRGSDDEIDDTDEELYYLQKSQASNKPLFISIQYHSLALALISMHQDNTIQLLLVFRQMNPFL